LNNCTMWVVTHTCSNDGYVYVHHDVQEQRVSCLPNSFMSQSLSFEIEVESTRWVCGYVRSAVRDDKRDSARIKLAVTPESGEPIQGSLRQPCSGAARFYCKNRAIKSLSKVLGHR
jgi:hypothetical protein